MPRAAIIGTGMFVPSRVVTNEDLTKLMDTSDEWIQKRSGIQERRYMEEGQTVVDLAYEAATRAIASAERKASDIDMILVSTLSPVHYFPGTASFLQARLGLDTTPALGLRAQCTGFIYGVQVAQAMIESGIHKRVLLVGADCHSRYLDFTDRGRDVAVLFGDGAGALFLEATEEKDRGILGTYLHGQGQHAKQLWIEYPATHIRAEDSIMVDGIEGAGKIYPKMNGRFVFKHAVTRMPEAIMEAMAHNNLTGDDVDMFLFHQANLRINEFIAKAMCIPEEKTYNNIQKYGNCSAGSLPMLMDECLRSGKLKRGSTAVLSAFGGGFTWGSAAIRF